MRHFAKIIALFLAAIAALAFLGAVGAFCLYRSADMGRPDVALDTTGTVTAGDGYREYRGNLLRQSANGIWEIYLKGDAAERGVANAKLAGDIIRGQEDCFLKQIHHYVPSESYLKFLRFFTVIFNRNLGRYVPEEYRTEILGLSTANTDDYSFFGTPYERQLNYHAAHDIGHMMQDFMLVGCSSFAAWGASAADSGLIVARNFDFYFGDDFSRNKLLMFVEPESGIPFVSVAWPGMIGVVSGMNIKGLTVTINASKGSLPTSARMPISILVRRILQYASTIDEAVAIARCCRTFVSESLLVSSAADRKAVIIEKMPDKMAVYESDSDHLACTNHFQSEAMRSDPADCQPDSPYRFATIGRLMAEHSPIDARSAVAIMRTTSGYDGEDIGLANEYSLNQSIAHHTVVFEPCRLRMLVSTSPWQSGAFVCYDLDSVFSRTSDWSHEIATHSADIAADTAFDDENCRNVLKYRAMIERLAGIGRSADLSDSLLVDSLIILNPNNFHTYKVAAEFWSKCGRRERAELYRRKSDELVPRLPGR